MASQSYKIPICRIHECGEYCAQMPIEKEADLSEMGELASMLPPGFKPMTFVYVDNPSYKNGKCDKSGKIEEKSIKIDNYDPDKTEVFAGDEKVIEDNEIFIDYHFPLKKTFRYIYRSKTGNGFTRKDIIYIISNEYKEIYRIEEETTPIIKKTFSKDCRECKEVKAIKLVRFNDRNTHKCFACHKNFKESIPIREIKCRHQFHSDCIKKWLEKNDVCPKCKKTAITQEQCGKCNNGKVEHHFEGKIIPVEFRGKLANRHKTHGKFGIENHDLEDLWIERLSYDPVTRKIDMFIGS